MYCLIFISIKENEINIKGITNFSNFIVNLNPKFQNDFIILPRNTCTLMTKV